MEPRPWWTSLRNGFRAVSRHRAVRWTAVILLLLVLFWSARLAVLRSLGRFLITEDPPCRVDAVYVLGGDAEMRGAEAARVFRQGWSTRFRFTGEPVPTALHVEGIERTEAEQTRLVALRAGVPDSLAVALNKGTSTYEEAGFILSDALAAGHDTVMIVSSRFHLRRIAFVFRERFREQGITVVLHGAPNGDYDEDRWWDVEEGLLMVNNEYVKLVYYRLKY